MMDIIARAEAAMGLPQYDFDFGVVPELVAELEAARAENERLRCGMSALAVDWKRIVAMGDYIDDGEAIVYDNCAEALIELSGVTDE